MFVHGQRHAGGWRNSGETFAIYAASRMSQLRKSSSAASHVCKTNKINYLQHSLWPCQSKYLTHRGLQEAGAVLDDVRNWLDR